MTTKGALVRSMLFPKPIGFKFYRDSIRFIMVLSGIAGLGFCASAVQFVKLGVIPSFYHPHCDAESEYAGPMAHHVASCARPNHHRRPAGTSRNALHRDW